MIKRSGDVDRAWQYAQEGGRAGKGKVIVEGFIDFDYEITQLTIRHAWGTAFCEPIGHIQIDGDYRESWQVTSCFAQLQLCHALPLFTTA